MSSRSGGARRSSGGGSGNGSSRNTGTISVERAAELRDNESNYRRNQASYLHREIAETPGLKAQIRSSLRPVTAEDVRRHVGAESLQRGARSPATYN
jgi:hypothetical protein